MATFVQTAVQLFSGGSKLTCNADQVDLDLTAPEVNFTNHCSGGWHEGRQGIRTWELNAQGFADYAAGANAATPLVPGEELNPALLGVARPLTVCPVDGSEGAVAYLAGGYHGAFAPLAGGVVGEAARFGITARAGDAAGGHKMLRGVLEANRTVSGNGNTTGSNALGAVAAGERVGAALHVISLAGTSPSITVKVQSDDNAGFTSPTDRLSFTAATTRSGQFAWLAGPVADTYWRALWTTSGSGLSIAIAVSIGIA